MNLFKQFIILSLLIISVASALIGVYYRTYVAGAIVGGIAERDNLLYAESFEGQVWRPLTRDLARPLCTTSARPGCINVNLIRQKLAEMPVSFPLLRLDVYDLNAKRLVASGGVFSDKSIYDQAGVSFALAKNGTVATSVITDADFQLPKGDMLRGHMIRTFIPLRAGPDGKTITEVIEIVQDVTPYWDKTLNLQLMATGIIVAVFLVLALVLSLASWRSQHIISKQHEANVELAKSAARAEAESVEKSKFLANVSHELRTPLNSIIGFSEIIRDEVMGPIQVPQYKEYAADIHSSGVHLLSLINDILDFSKADAGKLEVEMQETDVTKLMKSAIRLMKPKADEAQVHLADNLPSQHVVLSIDPKRLKQVVLNLLSNSVKFTPPGGTVTLSAHDNLVENTVTFEVRDTGVGMAEKDVSKAMATFGQLGNEYSGKNQGTGLGLPLSKKLVELMGGRFDIMSELGKGTVIAITLNKKPIEIEIGG